MAFVGSTTAVGASTTVTAAAPSGVATGDYQLAIISIGTESETITGVPSGWTLRGDVPSTGSGDSYHVYVYSSTTETASAAWTKSGSREFRVVRAAWSGVGAAGTLQIGINGTGTTHAIPAVTPQAVGATLIAGAVADNESSISFTPPAGWAERVDAWDSTRWQAITLADLTATGTGAVNGSFTSSISDEAVTFSVSLAVAAPADPPGSLFDLTNWKLTLPTDGGDGDTDADEITQPTLDTYSDANFSLNASNQLVMVAPVNGATTPGSDSTRDELREMEGGVEAAWSLTDAGARRLTVSGFFDPTNITGGTDPRTEMIIGQIHGELGSPPVYLAAEYQVATPRIRIFKYNGTSSPGFGNMLAGITPSTEITYRIEYDPGADPAGGTGQIKIYGAVGDHTNLSGTPDFTFGVADFFGQDTNLYLKAGAYNKTVAGTGSTGEARATITYLELIQPSGGAVVLVGDAAAASSATGAASVARPLAAVAAVAADVSGAASVARSVAGAAGAASSARGELAVARALGGSAVAAAAASGALSTAGDVVLAGVAAAASGASGALTLGRSLVGAAAAAAGAAGELSVGSFVCQDLAVDVAAVAYGGDFAAVAYGGAVTSVISHGAAAVVALEYGASDIGLCGR